MNRIIFTLIDISQQQLRYYKYYNTTRGLLMDMDYYLFGKLRNDISNKQNQLVNWDPRILPPNTLVNEYSKTVSAYLYFYGVKIHPRVNFNW